MNIDTAWLDTFLASPSGLAIKALLVGTIITAALGIFAALRDGTFAWKYLDSFVRATIWGRVAPVGVVVIFAYILGDDILTGAAVVIASAVGIGLIQAALESLRQLTLPKADSAIVNTTPKA